MAFKEFLLGELCEIKSSKRVYAKDYVTEGIPFYRSKEIIQKFNHQKINTELFISEQQFNEIKIRYGVPKEDDILLTSVGTLGIPYLVNKSDKFYFKDGNLTWFSSFDSKLESKYLYYWFTTELGRNEIDRITIGSTQKALTIENLKKMKVHVPSKEVQLKLIYLLDGLSGKIKNSLEIIQTLEEIANAIFERYFIDFEFPNEQGLPYRSSGGEMAESELGEIPRSWSISTINELGEIIGGGTPSKKQPEYYTEIGIPWITPKDLSSNKSKFIYKGNQDISELGLLKSSAKLMPKGTVLLSSRAPIGYIAIAGTEVTTNQGFKSIIPNKGYNEYFIYFKLREMLPTIEANAGGSTFKEISGNGLKAIQIILPDKEVVQQYAKVVSSLFEQIINLENQIANLITLRDALLPKLLSGEIEIPDESVVES